jgi:hypothetical protein
LAPEDDHAKPGDSEENKCQSQNSEQSTYRRAETYGRIQEARTRKVAVNLVRALSTVHEKLNLAGVLGARWETTNGRSKQGKKKRRRPPAPYTAITGYGTVNETPPFCAQITSPINRTRNFPFALFCLAL